MTKTILCLLALLAAPLLNAQVLYAVSAGNDIYSINEDYSINYIVTAIFPGNEFADVAISPSGTMYGIAGDKIYEINISTGEVAYLVQLPPDTYNVLVCSNDYDLYTVNLNESTLYKYNLINHETTNVAYLGVGTSGDITFYKGNLIFSSQNSFDGAGVIKAYNLETGTVKDVFCNPDFANFYGLTSLYNDCGNETVFGSNTSSQLFNVNIESQTLTPLAVQFPNDNQFIGMASTTEYLGSLCEPQELENISCFLSTDHNFKKEIIVYPNPATDVLYFKNADGVNVVTVYDVAGKIVQSVNKDNLASVDISGLANGMYLVKIESDNGAVMRKIIKR